MTGRLLSYLLVFFAASLFGQNLEDYVSSKGRNLFKSQQNNFLLELKLQKLTWNKADKTQIRFSKAISGEPFFFYGVPIVEAVFDFTGKKILSAMQISVYNRGDCGGWDEKKFKATVKTMENGLGGLTRDRQPEKSQRRLDGAAITQILWRTPGYDAALRWCGGADSTEYIMVNFAPRNTINKLNEDLRASVRPSELVNKINKEVDGTRWFDVPMVNQGDKGYCVAAVLERLMKYYNSSFDQHIFAQLAETDPRMGTDIFMALEALEQNAAKLRIRVKIEYNDKSFKDYYGIQNMLKDYNRLARKKKLPVVELDDLDKSGISLQLVFAGIDKETFIEARQKNKPGAKRFQLMVKDSIDRGIPLLWMIVVMPGELPMQPMASLHARIINGYNAKTSEIIYTDSWGFGHEKKAMPVDKAWAITTMILAVTPR